MARNNTFKPVLTIGAGIVVLFLAFVAVMPVPAEYSSVRFWCGVAAILITLWNTLYTVDQQEAAVLTMFGKFVGAGRAGLNWKIPFIVNIATTGFSLQVKEISVPVATFTGNSVPVKVEVAVQYYVGEKSEDVREAYFRLQKPEAQITSYVETAVRNTVPMHDTLDELLRKQKEIAEQVELQIGAQMQLFGYTIKTTLMKNVIPDQKVMAAMAAVAQAEYEKKAAEALGEADRIRQQKDGEGMGDKRAAMIKRLKEALDEFGLDSMPEAESQRIHDLIRMSITADALERMAASGNAKVIFTPGMSLDTIGTPADAMRRAIMEAHEGTEPRANGRDPHPPS